MSNPTLVAIANFRPLLRNILFSLCFDSFEFLFNVNVTKQFLDIRWNVSPLGSASWLRQAGKRGCAESRANNLNSIPPRGIRKRRSIEFFAQDVSRDVTLAYVPIFLGLSGTRYYLFRTWSLSLFPYEFKFYVNHPARSTSRCFTKAQERRARFSSQSYRECGFRPSNFLCPSISAPSIPFSYLSTVELEFTPHVYPLALQNGNKKQ